MSPECLFSLAVVNHHIDSPAAATLPFVHLDPASLTCWQYFLEKTNMDNQGTIFGNSVMS